MLYSPRIVSRGKAEFHVVIFTLTPSNSSCMYEKLRKKIATDDIDGTVQSHVIYVDPPC